MWMDIIIKVPSYTFKFLKGMKLITCNYKTRLSEITRHATWREQNPMVAIRMQIQIEIDFAVLLKLRRWRRSTGGRS